jgi:predicted RND superfamily exporter protein
MTPKLRSYIIIALTFLITLIPMVYGNVVVKKGGIVDDPLLNKADPFYVMDQHVRQLEPAGLKTGEPVTFVIPFDNGISKEGLSKIKQITDTLKARFPHYGILSLSTAANYQATSDSISSAPYLTDENLANPNFDLEQWKQKLLRDSGVYGMLIGKNFDYAQVVLFLPGGYNEIATFRAMVELLENRHVNFFEWFIKTNIKPTGLFQGVLPAGWVLGRGLMDSGMIASILIFSTVGVLLTRFASIISYSSVKQATISVSIMLLGFFWASGMVGLLQTLGCNLYIRVYFLLVLSVIICAADTYCLRKFMAYNDYRMNHPHIDRAEVWKATRNINQVIFVPAIVAILNFGLMYFIRTRAMLEIGIFSAISICFMLFLCLAFAPALQTIIGGDPSTEGMGRLTLKFKSLLDKIPRGCYRLMQPGTIKPFAIAFIILAPMLVMAVAITISDRRNGTGHKYIETVTRPLEYIKGSVVHQAGQYLNKPGRRGFDNLNVLVRLKGDTSAEPIYNPVFIRRVNEFSRRIEQLEGRQVNSIVENLKTVSHELYHKEFPTTPQEVRDILKTQIENDVDPLLKEQLWFDKGFVLFAALEAEDTNKIAALSDKVVALAKAEFPDLDVAPFGKMALYPRMDDYIKAGKLKIMAASQAIMIAVCALWIWWRNRRKSHRLPEGEGDYILVPWRAGLVMNLPFVLAITVIIGVMSLFRVPLDQATSTMQALAINAAADFSIYLIYDYQTALSLHGSTVPEALMHALRDKGRIIVMDIVLKVFCFAPMLLSTFSPVTRLGWIMMAMMVACGIGTLLLMPAFMPWCTRKRSSASL